MDNDTSLDDSLAALRNSNDAAIADSSFQHAQKICLDSRLVLFEACAVCELRGFIDRTMMELIQVEVIRGISLLRSLRWPDSVEPQKYASHCEQRLSYLRKLETEGIDATIREIAKDFRGC